MVDALGEILEISSAVAFGVIHGGVGIFNKLRRFSAVSWVKGNADAGARVDSPAKDAERLGEQLKNVLRDMGGVGFMLDVVDEDDKFVAALAADGVGGSESGFEPVGDKFQQLVAMVVPEGVVDKLKFVQVKKKHGKAAVVARAVQ